MPNGPSAGGGATTSRGGADPSARGAGVGRHRNPVRRVLFVSPEIPPWVKSGGLGDVTAALPAALRATGIDTRVLAPGYGAVLDAVRDVACVAEIPPLGGALPASRLLAAEDVNGAPLLLVDCPTYYRRPGTAYQDASFTDWADNHLRFGLLSRIAAHLGTVASPLRWRPDVIHCNDWPTALAPAYLSLAAGARAATVMGIHNMSHQGVFDAATLGPLGLPESMFGINGVEYYGKLSFLKAGLFYADRLVTVSPTYAREVQTDAGGQGLGGLLRGRGRELIGILNGIDDRTWNPATDTHITRVYTFATIERKAANKAALQRELGLPVAPERMLLGVISRLAHQKGIDWLLEIADALPGLPVQLAVLGSGERELEQQLATQAAKHPGAISAVIGFDEALAHRIEAGADAFVMPSRFEPCGLNQMYSLRYGTPPIVRATGGLADTVVDCGDDALRAGIANGFGFIEANAAALLLAIERALAAWGNQPVWRALQRRGMAQDFSWAASAQRYHSAYKAVVASRNRD